MARPWSFCIVTSNNDYYLQQVVSSILNSCKDRVFEIVIVGDTHLSFDDDRILLINYSQSFSFWGVNWLESLKKLSYSRKIPISEKKNIAVDAAKYENICLLHDYVILSPGWLDGYEEFGYNWDVCSNIILDKGGNRFLDWVVWAHPHICGPGYVDYKVDSKYKYISGTFFCTKKSFYTDNPLNEKLYWGEGEDVEWSLRIRDAAVIKFNPHSTVLLAKDKGDWYISDQWALNTNKLCEFYKDK